jgi:hypothetical protein
MGGRRPLAAAAMQIAGLVLLLSGAHFKRNHNRNRLVWILLALVFLSIQ